MHNTTYIQTIESACKGCNKCIFKCPVKANEAFFEADECKVFIKPGYCISCGECLNICDHDAREYTDDCDSFFEQIKAGEKFSVIIAPAAKFSFAAVPKLISYLKSIGVNNVYDVSFGADICTWGHVKAVRENGIKEIIAQPCPVVVSYIEKYQPELIGKLSPLHSPATSLAIYLKKYVGVTDKILFLSPCIGKKRECESDETHGVIELNVTFAKFLERIKSENVNLDTYEDSKFDNAEGSIGFTFSRPGGLSENIKAHLGQDIWIKQIEGIHKIKEYLHEYIEDVKEGRPVPVIVDVLNCSEGCNLGTGTNKDVRLNAVDYELNKQKSVVNPKNTESLMEYFDSKLKVEDFIREYKDRSFDYKINEEIDLEKVFISLGKITEEDRRLNCFSCGYGSCLEFAYDLAMGHNNRNNCRHYLLNKFKKLSAYDELTGLNNRYSYHLAITEFRKNHPGFIGLAYIDINGLKDANDTKGHSYGDKLIITCADILKKVFDSKAYRIGGDEFIIMDDCTEWDVFNGKLREFILLVAKENDLSVSVGTAVSESAIDIDEKLDEADKSMYIAKQEHYRKSENKDRRVFRKRLHD